MDLSAKEYQHLVQEIARETGAKRDGTGKNLIVPRCPFCGKSGGKFGIYIGPETALFVLAEEVEEIAAFHNRKEH